MIDMNIKDRRKELGMTQQELANMSGINIRQIQRFELETSKIENITLINAKRLADALGIQIDDLLKWEGQLLLFCDLSVTYRQKRRETHRKKDAVKVQ